MSYQPVNLYYLYTASKVNITDYRIYEKLLSNRSKVTNLGEREKNILSLRFMQGMTQTEVAKEIGISQAQVSRLEKGALDRIKSHHK